MPNAVRDDLWAFWKVFQEQPFYGQAEEDRRTRTRQATTLNFLFAFFAVFYDPNAHNGKKCCQDIITELLLTTGMKQGHTANFPGLLILNRCE